MIFFHNKEYTRNTTVRKIDEIDLKRNFRNFAGF